MSIDGQKKSIIGRNQQILREGDVITVDGTHGEVLVGHVETVEAGLNTAVTTLLGWADELRDIGIRANGIRRALRKRPKILWLTALVCVAVSICSLKLIA